MPTYEYLCEKCEHEFERDQRISDPPVKTCPKCRSRKVTKLISRTSFVLKGGGWYSDLYSSTSGKKDAGGEKGEKSDAPSSGSTSDAKSSDAPAKTTADAPKDKGGAGKPGSSKSKKSAA